METLGHAIAHEMGRVLVGLIFAVFFGAVVFGGLVIKLGLEERANRKKRKSPEG